MNLGGKMNKNEIVEVIATKTISKKHAREIVELVFTTLKERLKNDEKISISGFGSFSTKFKSAKEGRNPKTGKKIVIKERRVVKFKASKKFYE